jgi:hypothetical protein
MNANVFITKDYENISDWTLGENKPNSKPNKPCPACPLPNRLLPSFGAGSAVEKFLSLCPESVTIIRKSVIRQFKKGRLDWLLLGTVTKIILEHSPVGSGLNLEISCHANAILFGKDRF